ncbi:hypothetical protein CDAR_91941 [Caerostris darwini]|uniref:Uncharacterized protein n=1 Tax=Caerostris darwini TaxID=1538125 RepID=A0AAV4QLN8_9ARAC|nr:hypothetical protein CDAR_91941 [Caerostris darwini]
MRRNKYATERTVSGVSPKFKAMQKSFTSSPNVIVGTLTRFLRNYCETVQHKHKPRHPSIQTLSARSSVEHITYCCGEERIRRRNGRGRENRRRISEILHPGLPPSKDFLQSLLSTSTNQKIKTLCSRSADHP